MNVKLKVVEGYIYSELGESRKAFIKFSIDNSRLYVISTFVPEEHRGKGVATELMFKLLEFATTNGLEIVPLCSYAVSFFIKNREKRALLASPFKNMSDEELSSYYEKRLREEETRRSLRLEEERGTEFNCPIC
ncbi:MAG: GNAT family N-acetyltransferase [Acidilobaceae archaeon]